MVAGDTVAVLAGGSYDERVVPSNSGTAEAAITYRAGEGVRPKVRAFNATGKSYITIDGFEITNEGFSTDRNPSVLVTGTTGVKILNNYIHDTSAHAIRSNPNSGGLKAHNLLIQGNTLTNIGPFGTRTPQVELWGDGNLVESNDLSHGEDFFRVYGARNVIRNNTMHDAVLSDFTGTPHLDGVQSYCNGTPAQAANYLLIEGNTYRDNPDPDEHFALINGTESCGGSTTVILRYNTIANIGSFAYVSDTNNNRADHHKFYNNTVVNGGIGESPKRNHVAVDMRGSSYGSVINNLFVDAFAVTPPAQGYVLDSSGTSNGDYNLGYMSTGNITWSTPLNAEPNGILNRDPLLMGGTDFRLQAGSPAKQAGGPLTTVATRDSGSGTTLAVVDAHFFQDGWAGAQADWIAVGNSGNTAQISSIDYATDTVILTAPISRSPGQPVWLYKNSRGETVLLSASPDIGAIQHPPTSVAYFLPESGGGSWTSTEIPGQPITSGYATIQPIAGGAMPSGVAVIGLRQNGVLVSEAGVPASPALRTGRIYAEISAPINTGLALANPNNQSVTVSFYFTGAAGDFGHGSTTIAANAQMAAFLDQFPFNGQSGISGTFTFSADAPIAAMALRTLTNERGEFLMTTLPLADLSAPAPLGSLVFPHFADGGGWTTQVVLVNPTSDVLTGTVEFRDPAGNASMVNVDGETNSSFRYSIPARAADTLPMSGTSSLALMGSVRISPAAGTAAPSGLIIFSLRNGTTTVTSAGVPVLATANVFRLYAESTAEGTQTGVAVANVSPNEAVVALELRTLDGSTTGLAGTLTIPANGQHASFLRDIPGLASLHQTTFRGVLRLSSTASISVLALRGRFNERGDFLIATTPAIAENTPESAATLYFPHIVNSGGFTTQFILFGTQTGQASAGRLAFLTQTGSNWELSIR
jgi:hypothetical protein